LPHSPPQLLLQSSQLCHLLLLAAAVATAKQPAVPITVAQAVSAASGDAAAVAGRNSQKIPRYSICCMKSL